MVTSGLNSKDVGQSVKCCPLLSSDELVVLLPSLVLRSKGFPKKKRSPPSWKASYIIYSLLGDLGPPFVDHVGHFSSACPISHFPKPSVSCSNQSSIVQE